MSTFQAPMRVFGESKDNPTSDAGDVVVTQINNIVFGDTTKALFRLPPNCDLVEINIDVTTAFNAATTNTIAIGKAGGATDFFADAQSVASKGRVLGSAGASELSRWRNTGDTGIELTATYAQTGTAATAGEANITAIYVVKKVLPT